MPGRALPNLGLKGFFTVGEAGWGADVDDNFLRLSVLTQGSVVSKVSTTPLSPTDGQVYIFDQTHPTFPNRVAVRDNGAWYYLNPAFGWSLYNITAGRYEDFTTVWTTRPLTNFNQKVSLNGLSTYTFSAIPQNYTNMKIVLNGATTQAVLSSTPVVTVNGLATAIYSNQRQYSLSTTNTANQSLLGTSIGAMAGLAGTTAPANTSTFIEMDFFDYSNTTFRKLGKYYGREPASTTTTGAYNLHGIFEINTITAITSVTIENATLVPFANGSTLSLTLTP